MTTRRVEIVQPEHFARPRGYSNGVIVSAGRTLYVAGQVGWEPDGTFASSDFARQFARALDNVVDVVRAAGGEPHHIVKMTVYVTDTEEYKAKLREVGDAWRTRIGRHFPAMALVRVAGLVEDGAKVEIEAIAALPEEDA